jgi:hypothetical protein
MSAAAVNLGRDAASAPDDRAWAALCERVSRMTGKRHVRPTASGTGAVFAALYAAEGPVLVPDMGGSLAFRTHPKVLGLEALSAQTELGAIDLDLLEGQLGAKGPKTFLYSSSSGHLAENDSRRIADLCHDHGARVIEDISGVLGRKDAGSHADVVVCSTGPGMVAGLVSGGFVATDVPDLLESSRLALSLSAPDPVACAGMAAALEEAPRAYEALVEACSQLKRDLEEHPQVVHRERRGIGLGLDLSEGVLSPQWVFQRSVQAGLLTDLNSPIVMQGPRYERLTVPSVTVELKKIDVAYYERDALVERLVEAIDGLLRPQASVAQLARAADS